MLWYTENLLSIAWYGAMVPLESLRWETAWKIRKMAEGKGLLVLHSDTEYDLREVAKVLLDNDKVKSIVYKYLKEIGELNYNS